MGPFFFFLGKNRKLLKRVHDKDQASEQDEGTWREKLMSRLARVLDSHVIKIDVERIRPRIPDADAVASVGRSSDVVEARGNS